MLEGQLKRDELFINGDSERIWKNYCGFLDLSVDEFMKIQELLLMEQMELAANSKLGQKIMGGQKPKTVEEFRSVVPFTTYQDYEPYLGEQVEDVLSRKPATWAHTSGRTGLFKWTPYTLEMLGRLADDTLAAFILSSASRKGEVRLTEGTRVVLNLPPPPYMTGIMAVAAGQRLLYRAIPPLQVSSKLAFEDRIKESYKTALKSGVDYAASIAVVLTKVGESYGQLGNRPRGKIPWHPMAIVRLLKAVAVSKMLKRPLLPKDIWKVKGLVCGGTDTSIYRDQIYRYWGVQPLDIYVSTESCFIAMQGWNKKGLNFVPYSNFYEFIPEKEWLKSREDPAYKPSSLLINQLEEGKVYEIVITNFHGGAYLRYRIGDLIKIISLKDEETGVNLPQMIFFSRADDIIDMAGFARFDEKTVWQAIQGLGIPYADWSARKEYREGKPVLNIYLELMDNKAHDHKELERLIDQQFVNTNADYKDLREMTGTEPLVVTLLDKGAFAQYQEKKRAAGYDLAHLKPPHMCASDSVMKDLLFSGQDG